MMAFNAATPQQVMAALETVRAIGEAIRDLTELNGGVPSGELYAHLMGAGMNLADYNYVLDVLKNAKVIKIENHYITWTGTEKES